MKKCPYCAEEIQDEASFCRFCGHDVRVALPPVGQPAASTPPTKAPSTNRTSPLAWGCLLTLLFGGGFCVWSATQLGEREQKRQAYRDKLRVTVASFTTKGNYCYVRGEIENVGDETVRYWRLTARFLDKNRGIVDTDFTNSIERLPPDAKKQFEMMQRCDSRYVSVDVGVEEVRLAD